MPPCGKPVAAPHWSPNQWLRNRAMEMVITDAAVVSKPTATPEMIVVAGTVFAGSPVSLTRRPCPPGGYRGVNKNAGAGRGPASPAEKKQRSAPLSLRIWFVWE